ncbi:MAG: MarR family transcriptional regulator [Bacteroidaceae bacterium]|jgi:DNA-binding MarR family transcriptional regulator|nr:MarR family transcriptional regulator [Bacteroidaceae bacterium]
MTPTTTLDYRLIFALMNGKVSTALRRRLNADFRAAGLEVTGEQWDVLMAISSRDLCTQQDLCEATSFSKPTMTRTINVLEEMHLVTRRKARVDFRRNYISLTIKGLNMVDHAQAIAVRTLKECLRGLSKMEMLTAQNSLNIVLENLRRQEQQRAQKQSEEQHRTAEANRRAVRRMHAAASGKR